MALDGLVIANLRKELNDQFAGGRINKIAQPESDELILTIKGNEGQKRLLISASASLPIIYMTEKNKPNPMTAPNFCMLLRKHISGGKIISVTQPDLERALTFEIEHLNEMGDLCRKKLIVELMGKHSNIIFCEMDDTIIDSIKHIPAFVSSVREVLPGRKYFLPSQEGKLSALEETRDHFVEMISSKPTTVCKAIYGTYVGISPLIANEIAYRAGLDGDAPCASLSSAEISKLYDYFFTFIDDIKNDSFTPNIVYKDDKPVEFSSIELTLYPDYTWVYHDSISEMLYEYFERKNAYTRIHQKSSDLRQLVGNLLDRARKKYALQQKQLSDTDKRDKYQRYGELIHVYGYSVPEGSSGFEALDYETNEMVKIPLDKDLSIMENAKKYYDRYAKLKRTYEALTEQIAETADEVAHLESIATSLDMAENEADLSQIRDELASAGYVRRVSSKKKGGRKEISKPHHYVSSDGYDIYVGKNNSQNDELTFKFATGNDWWFHAKSMPGSHVIVKCKDGEMPDRTFEEAGALAAYYSKGREADQVEIDYLQKKNVKKPNGSKPGFVVYYTNHSLNISPDISGIKMIE